MKRGLPLSATTAAAAAFGALLVAAAALTVPVADGLVALFAAAVIGAELLVAARDDQLADPPDAETFRLSTPLLLAAMIVVGPWPAALAGGLGVLAAGLVRRSSWQETATRGLAVSAAAVAGAYAFQLAGGQVDRIALPEDVLAICALAAVFAAVQTLVHSVTAGLGAFQPDPRTLAAETGLGTAVAFAVLEEPWLLAAVVPVMALLDHVYNRLLTLRGEVAAALETFANIVDERDPSTYRHSVRVAAYVDELARALGLPQAEVVRLRWAGRLHDLGKVAVDAAVLRKRSGLSNREWATVQRAPRLSARLLHRFRFAAQQARAVEYHHESLDGSGYYGVRGDAIPLASHFLALADSFDAMTTDRPFRPALSRAEALAEIERWSGTQFHPTLARAFVAVQRGQPIADALSPAELSELREACLPTRRPVHLGLRARLASPAQLGIAGVLVGVVGLSAGVLELAALGGAAALLGGCFSLVLHVRTTRLAAALERSVATSAAERVRLFEDVAARLAETGACWTGLVAWREDGLGGSIELEAGGEGPEWTALVSWLVRHAGPGAEPFAAAPPELHSPCVHVALPLRRENSELAAFLVSAFARAPAPHVVPALRESLHLLGPALTPEPSAVRRPRLAAAR